MFGGFNISAGLTSLKDFNDKLTKMKEDMERNIETSLGLDGQAEIATAAATGSGRFWVVVCRSAGKAANYCLSV